MKLLLDESAPRRLASLFPAWCEMCTVQRMGWAGVGNGDLLRLAAGHGFDALVTVDRGFESMSRTRTDSRSRSSS